jgi:hypothetical protein
MIQTPEGNARARHKRCCLSMSRPHYPSMLRIICLLRCHCFSLTISDFLSLNVCSIHCLITLTIPQGSLDLSPWLFVLPSELSPFRQLLKKVGVSTYYNVYVGAGAL